MIGLFGGTFDPVHKGHIRLAQQAIDRLDLEQVQLMPCANPVHRDPPKVTSEHRLNMLQKAIDPYSKMQVNTLEIDRVGPSYMVDSLSLFAEQNRKSTICLLVGSDTFRYFSQWKSPSEILQMAHLVICCRPGSVVDKSVFADHHTRVQSDLYQRDSGHIFELEMKQNPCSSTQVRSLLAATQSVENCLIKPVINYIKKNRLYEKKCE